MKVAGMSKKPLFLMCFAALGLSPMISVSARAQVSGGCLSGSVTDNSGGVVPHTQIEIRNVATGVVNSDASNGDGFYTASNLLSGTYQVSVSKQGFKTRVRPASLWRWGLTKSWMLS